MKTICSCIHCGKEYSSKGIFTHVDRAHLKLTKYSSGNNGKYAEISDQFKLNQEKKKEDYNQNPKYCISCNCELSFSKRTNKFCSKSCSATYNNTGRVISKEQKIKTSETLTGKKYVEPISVTAMCICGDEFLYTKLGNKERTYCSRSCATKYSPSQIRKREEARQRRTPLQNYRAACAFKFALNDYPNEFDFSLVEKYGWYKAKNRVDNLNGISRDHIISVRYGFDHGIDPAVISHPANCRLIRHNDNVSKGIKCEISLEMLIERIYNWNVRHQK